MRHEIADSAQEELNRIEGWCGDNNGKQHSGKAVALWYSLNNRAVKDIMPKVYMYNNEISCVHVIEPCPWLNTQPKQGKFFWL